MADATTHWPRIAFDVFDDACGGPRRQGALPKATLAAADMSWAPPDSVSMQEADGKLLEERFRTSRLWRGYA